MRQIIPTVLSALVLFGGLGYGQSLGDVARQIKQQKQKNGTVAKRVVTTDDLSPDPNPAPDTKPDEPKKDGPKPLPYRTVGTSGFTPEDWKRSIKAQKDWIAHLQAEADKLKTPAQFDPKKVATDPEARRLSEERSIQEQFASEIPEEKKKLKEAQDEARRAGMPPEVYDPQ